MVLERQERGLDGEMSFIIQFLKMLTKDDFDGITEH